MREILNFMIRIEGLKRTARTGWNMEFPPDSRFKTRKVDGAESVADHSWSVAMFALAVAYELGLNPLKIVSMAMVHDVSELITLDIVTATLDGEERRRAEAEKYRLENAAMREIFLPLGDFGRRCYALWLEFEDQVSPEARVLKQIDKLETCIQALLYGEQGHVIEPEEFLIHANSYMKDPEFVAILAMLRERLQADAASHT